MTHPAACTIASNNYLAYAKVFARSYKSHHPGAEVYVCIADRRDASIAYERLPFVPVFAEEFGIPAFLSFAFRYDIIEFNTAVKPYFLRYLRDRHQLDRVLYFDPDVLVLDSLQGLAEGLDRHAALLTPHVTEPLGDLDRPLERAILMAGVYNLGFLGLRLDDSSRGFLEWWGERLYTQCVSDVSRGLFVDQSWMDFAPAFLDSVGIVRDPTFNIAYWNLAQRHPTFSDGHWRIDGRRVGFFHFSGVDLNDLNRISRYQERLSLRQRPELRPLFEDYRSRLLTAGHRRFADSRYGFADFGRREIPIHPAIRRLLLNLDPRGRRWPDPFAIHVPDSFLGYLTERLEFAHGALNRAVLALWEERPDMQRDFPEVCGRDLPRYVDWLLQCGEGVGLHRVFLSGLTAGTDHRRRKRPSFLPDLQPFDHTGDRGAVLAQTLDYSAPGTLTRWLNEPVPGTACRRPTITRLALLVHRLRIDLQNAYPDPLGNDQTRFAYWLVTHGAVEFNLHPALVAPIERSLSPRQRLASRLSALRLRRARKGVASVEAAPTSQRKADSSRRPSHLEFQAQKGGAVGALGVNLAAYFDMDTGVAQAGRGAAAALAHAGIAVARLPLEGSGLHNARKSAPYPLSGTPYGITIIHANADQTPRVMQLLPVAAAAGSYAVGCWFWELAHFPLQFAGSFEYLDEVWAPSRFCQRSFEAIAPVPVLWVPPHVPPPQPRSTDRRELGLDPQRFYFYSAFDVASIPERKNPRGTIEAFGKLTRLSRRPVGLVLKVNRARQAPAVMSELREAAIGLPVSFFTEPTSRNEVDALVAACDASLSLHRSEGLGLVPIESLYLEKPVVATAYGGVTDFLDEATCFTVEFSLRRLDCAHPPYPAGAVWAEPDIDKAAAAMLHVVERPDEARSRALAGRQRVETLYGLEAAAKRYREHVDRIRRSLGGCDPATRVSSGRGAVREQPDQEGLSVQPS